MKKVNLEAAFGQFDVSWTPHVAVELNGQQVKLAKLEGAFVWHDHANEDEMFWVVSGRLRIEFRDAEPVVLEAGEFVVVPRGVEHRPVAEPTAEVVLFEPATTKHTGEVETERTVRDLPRL